MGKTLGERISEMLRKQGIQQKELAERIGITEAAMSRYIAGTREPKPDVIANMATALHTTSDYLLGIENDAFNYHQVRRMVASRNNRVLRLVRLKMDLIPLTE